MISSARGLPSASRRESAPAGSGAPLPRRSRCTVVSLISEASSSWLKATTIRASGGATSASPSGKVAVTATFPEGEALVAPPLARIVVAFSHELDASLINDTTVHLERLGSGAPEPAGALSLRLAEGNPRALLIIPRGTLAAGSYRLTLRGSGGGALADVNARALGSDYVREFIVDLPAVVAAERACVHPRQRTAAAAA